MATVQTVYGIDFLKSSEVDGTLRAFRVTVGVSGTYLTAAKPNFNVLSALQNSHAGITAVKVKSAVAFRDYSDGSNVYTASNAVIALANVNSGSTNDKVTFTVESGATNGDTGSEVADATALTLAGQFQFIVVAELIFGSAPGAY
jgi:hypothetical protein